MKDDHGPRWWTSVDAARRLGVTPRRVQQLARDGDLAVAEETSWGLRLFAQDAVMRLQNHRVEQRARRLEKLRRLHPKMLRATVTITTSGMAAGAKASVLGCETKRAGSLSDRARVV